MPQQAIDDEEISDVVLTTSLNS